MTIQDALRSTYLLTVALSLAAVLFVLVAADVFKRPPPGSSRSSPIDVPNIETAERMPIGTFVRLPNGQLAVIEPDAPTSEATR